MKRKMLMIISIVLAVVSALTGCTPSGKAPDSEAKNDAAKAIIGEKVPDYVGKKYDDLTGVSQFNIIREYDPEQPEGVIIRQKPQAGTALEDKTITLVLNSVEVDIPDFVGKGWKTYKTIPDIILNTLSGLRAIRQKKKV